MKKRFILFFILLFFIFTIYFLTYNNQNNENKDNNFYYKALFCPENDCNLELYNYFTNSKNIKCAVYAINEPWIIEFIKNNKNIHIIMDDDELKKINLISENIKTDSSNNYMHNKFCIFDSNILWIGSLNFTTDSFLYQNNNVIITNNKNHIEKAEKQFNNYWNNNFKAIEKNEEICFSPNNCIDLYLDLIKNSQKEIKCMFFSFTYDALSKEIIDKNLNTKIILEKQQNSQYSEYQKLKDNNILVIWDKNPKYMHNKFCIIDYYVITGSMNPSNNGNEKNEESIIIINDYNIYTEYNNYFNKYYSMWSE